MIRIIVVAMLILAISFFAKGVVGLNVPFQSTTATRAVAPADRFEGYTDLEAARVSRDHIRYSRSIRRAHVLSERKGLEEYALSIRAQCGGWREVLADIDREYQTVGPEGVAEFEEVEENYSEILAQQAMRKAVKNGTMHEKCLVDIGDLRYPAMRRFALWTSSGDDYIFGFEPGKSFSPLSRLNRKDECCQYNVIRIGNFIEGYNEEMQKRLIVTGLQEAPQHIEVAADRFTTGSFNH